MRVSTPRRPFAFAALASLLVLSLSCGGDSGDPSPTPTEILVTPGADTLLSVGETQAFVAVVLDANGDPIDDAEVAWSSTAPGVVSVDPVTGLATAVTNGSAQVRAISGALEGAAPVTVAQVPATVTVSPSTGNFTFAGDTLTFTATVLDAGGSPVTPVQKIWTINDNTVAVIDSNGFARAKSAGLAMVTVVAIGPGGAKAGYAAVQSTQPVASLVFRVQPAAVEAGEALDPAIQAEVRDSGGSIVAGYTGPVTLGIDSGPDGAILRGTKTVNAISGVVSWSGLWLELAGTYRFAATAASLSPAVSSAFPVAPAAPARIQIVLHPSASPFPTIAGEVIEVGAVVFDRFGNLLGNVDRVLELELLAGPVGAEISGEVAAQYLDGFGFYFPDAELRRAGSGYQLRIVSPGLLPDTTMPFSVIPAAPVRLNILPGSALATRSLAESTMVTVQVTDSFLNPVAPPSMRLVDLAVIDWPYAAPEGRGQVIGPTSSAWLSADTVSFDNIYFTRPGSAVVVASAIGLLPDTAEIENRGLRSVVDIIAGGTTTCVRSGQLCVGGNTHGELGVASTALGMDSVLIPADSLFDDSGPYATRGGVVCGVDYITPDSRTVMCRGRNDEGQLGMGSAGPGREQFVRVSGLDGAWRVAVGAGHVCALAADSTAVCWGRNDHGQLGRGTVSPFEAAPGAVSGGVKFKWIAAGSEHSCGVTAAGGVRCWGGNASGQLGDSTLTDSPIPVTVVGTNTYSRVEAGNAFTCAIRSVGGLPSKTWCWGTNALGQLGDSTAGSARNYPAPLTHLQNDLPTVLALGAAHACAYGNGYLICWGDNSRGQIGNGSSGGAVPIPYLRQLPAGTFLGALGAGDAHTCMTTFALGSDTEYALCWGANDLGQLGDGTTTDRGSPTMMIQ